MATCPMSRLDWACRELVGIGPRMDSCEKTSLSAEATFFCYEQDLEAWRHARASYASSLPMMILHISIYHAIMSIILAGESKNGRHC